MKASTSAYSLLLLAALGCNQMVYSQPANFLPQCLNLPAKPLTQGWNLVPDIQNQDDAVTLSPLPLGFYFNFYGSSVNSLYASSNSWFSPVPPIDTGFRNLGLDNTTYPIIAPLWDDTTLFLNGATAFYTSNPANRTFAFVFYRVGRNGSFGRATWQVIISDGFYAPMGIGNNICFCYQNSTWSSGSPTMGVSNGDGVHFSALPIVPPDGIAPIRSINLTNTSFCFNTRLPVKCDVATAQFILVDAANATYQDLGALCNGSYIDYADNPLISIRYIPRPGPGKVFNKVRYFANGVRTRNVDEYDVPYSINGDPNASGHYRPWIVKPGPYVIRADVMRVSQVVASTTIILNIFDSRIKR